MKDIADAGARYGWAQIVLHWTVVLLVIEQYATSGAILRIHAYRPLGSRPNPFDLTLHSIHTRIGLLIFVLVAARLLLRMAQGAPAWATRHCRHGEGGCRRASSSAFTASFWVARNGSPALVKLESEAASEAAT